MDAQRPLRELQQANGIAHVTKGLGVLAEPFIVQRADHMDALAFGLGVTEHDTNGKAAAELRELWTWVNRKMEGKAHGQAKSVA